MSNGALGAVGIVLSILVVTGGIVGLAASETVPEGHVGVETEWGAVNGQTLEPDLHFITPMKDGIRNVEIRPRTYSMVDTQGEGDKAGKQDAVVVQTINGTTVRVDVTVRYRVNENESARFVRQWDTVEQAEHRLIRPTVRSELRDEAADIQTTEIYTAKGREALGKAARKALDSEFADEALVLEAVQVRDVDLPESYDKALDQKEIAKQRVEREHYRVEQEKQRAEKKRVAANADAEVIRIRGEALRNNPVVLQDRRLDAMNGSNVWVVPENSSSDILISPRNDGGESEDS